MPKPNWTCECGAINQGRNIRCSKCKVYPSKPKQTIALTNREKQIAGFFWKAGTLNQSFAETVVKAKLTLIYFNKKEE